MAFKKIKVPTEPIAENTAPATADAQPIEPSTVEPSAAEAEKIEEEVFEAYSGPATFGTQFLELISKDAAGNKVEAMKIGQLGVLVVTGFSSAFIPGADIVDRGNGKQIV